MGLQVKGSGLANTCPVIEGGSTNIRDLPAGDYAFDKFCMEPTSFKVKEDSQLKGDSEFVDTKLVTRLTYTLDDMSGKMKIGGDGKVSFIEEDGIDYAPTTVQGRGGSTGYDTAVAFPARGDDEELAKENTKN